MNLSKIAHKQGELLAHILASEKVFENKVVSFCGFSLGAKVIYNCLSTMADLGFDSKVSDVIFMAGAQSI